MRYVSQSSSFTTTQTSVMSVSHPYPQQTNMLCQSIIPIYNNTNVLCEPTILIQNNKQGAMSVRHPYLQQHTCYVSKSSLDTTSTKVMSTNHPYLQQTNVDVNQ